MLTNFRDGNTIVWIYHQHFRKQVIRILVQMLWHSVFAKLDLVDERPLCVASEG
jgi:hypothetical protein